MSRPLLACQIFATSWRFGQRSLDTLGVLDQRETEPKTWELWFDVSQVSVGFRFNHRSTFPSFWSHFKVCIRFFLFGTDQVQSTWQSLSRDGIIDPQVIHVSAMFQHKQCRNKPLLIDRSGINLVYWCLLRYDYNIIDTYYLYIDGSW